MRVKEERSDRGHTITNEDDGSRFGTALWLRDVGVEATNGLNAACWLACVYFSAEAA